MYMIFTLVKKKSQQCNACDHEDTAEELKLIKCLTFNSGRIRKNVFSVTLVMGFSIRLGQVFHFLTNEIV